MKNKQENGFALLEVLLIGLVAVLVVAVVYFAYQAGQNTQQSDAASSPSPSVSVSSSPSATPATEKASTLTVANAASRLTAAGMTVKDNGKPYLDNDTTDGVILSINDAKARVDIIEYKDASTASAQVSQYSTAFTNGKILVVITNDINTGSTTVDSALTSKIKSALQ